jgi:hypothetical protein
VTVDANRNVGGITFSNTSGLGYKLDGATILLSNNGVIRRPTETASTPTRFWRTLRSRAMEVLDGSRRTPRILAASFALAVR